MLVVHGIFVTEPEGMVALWAEDGSVEPPTPGRKPRRTGSRARTHPFASTPGDLRGVLASIGSSLVQRAALCAVDGEMTLWLPGGSDAPVASPQLVRSDGDAPPEGVPAGLSAWRVPTLLFVPGAGLDVLVVLAGLERPGVAVSASVVALATVAELALEVVAGGRVLPDLVTGCGGRREARWRPLATVADRERIGMIATALPPVCRSLDEAGFDPHDLVSSAVAAFVDALCREGGRAPVLRRSGRDGVVSAWLEALGPGGAEVEASPGELVQLDRLVAEWRSGAAAAVGPWRLCFRLVEPEPAAGDDRSGVDVPDPDDEWSVELLLQATDDLSLVVEASEVWRSGDRLLRATRSLEAPHDVLLAELGRAVHAFPELEPVLREPAPTALRTDLAGAHRFLAEIAPALEVAGYGVLLPAWWRRPGANLGVRLRTRQATSRGGAGGGLLNRDGLVEFDWQAALGDESVGLGDLRRLAALKAPLVRVRGRWMELRPDEIERLVRFLSEGRRAGKRTMSLSEILRVAAGASALDAGVPVVGVDADGLLAALLRGELEETLEVRPTPAGFSGELRPYQKRGVAWLELLERSGLGACLADDMGLGKTATVLAVLQAERERRGSPGPTLVVCPTSVVGNWQREAERFVPELRVLVHHGARRSRGADFPAAVAAADLVVTSYPLVERDRQAFAAVTWWRLVLDEAQQVKNPSAKQTRAVRALAAGRRIALSGTPVENHLGELWSIMEIVNPGLLGTESAFREHFAVPIERYREEDAAQRLRTLTRPFVLRRLKSDRSVITDLPDKLEMKEHCSLTKEQATLYQAVVDEMVRRIDEAEGIERKGLVLSTMLRLKQVCNHPAQYLGDGSALAGRSGKLERTVEILEEVLESGERALVFSQFSEMGEMLRRHLAERLGRHVGFLHGGVSRRRRDELVAAFQDESGDMSILVVSLKAGGTGLNLTAANHVVHFDRWWNPAVEDQATDRAYRIGQRRHVQVRKLVCAGTVEDKIDLMIEAKRDLADRIVGSGESWLTELTTDELVEVFGLSAELVTS